jgi:phage terminase small subunit
MKTSKLALNPKQLKFCQLYIKTGNATKAAQGAGYSEKTADVQGSTLLRNPKIRKHLEKYWNKAAETTSITSADIIAELKKIGFAQITDYVSFNGVGVSMKDSAELPPEKVGAISEVSSSDTKYGVNVRFKLHDKIAALEKIARLMGLITDKIDHTTDGKPINLTLSDADIQARVDKYLKITGNDQNQGGA